MVRGVGNWEQCGEDSSILGQQSPHHAKCRSTDRDDMQLPRPWWIQYAHAAGVPQTKLDGLAWCEGSGMGNNAVKILVS